MMRFVVSAKNAVETLKEFHVQILPGTGQIIINTNVQTNADPDGYTINLDGISYFINNP